MESNNLMENNSAIEERQTEKTTTPGKMALKMNSNRLGVIFSNMSYFLVAAISIAFFGLIFLPLIYILNFLIAIIISVLTLGLIFLAGSFSNLIIIRESSMEYYGELFSKVVPIAIYILCAVCILSLIFLYIDKKNAEKSRIVTGYIFLILSVIAIAIMLIGGLNG